MDLKVYSFKLLFFSSTKQNLSLIIITDLLQKEPNMDKSLLDILVCPVCKGELKITIEEERDGEIWTGTLTCSKCNYDYPIEEGIPSLLPPGQNKE
jgi:uncharacterized protein YbaR (Trm112 family)